MSRRLPKLLAALSLGLLAAGCGPPPQLGGDAEGLKATDALLTAISAHDAKLLERCEQHLATLKESGHLPSAAYEHLQAIVEQARSGNWDAARARLSKFIKAQRRAPQAS